MKLILSSKSPRRKELINNLGFPYEIKIAEADESHDPSLSPEETVKFISYTKANAALTAFSVAPDEVIIGADTIVAVDDEILGKPKNREDAVRMLKLLSGRTHSVYTGVTLIYRNSLTAEIEYDTFAEKTDVTFEVLTDGDINSYIENDPPFDKAGSYAIQGSFCVHVKGICGDYNNVVGFPVAAVFKKLRDIQKQTVEI